MPLARSCAQHACFLTGCQASHDVLASSMRACSGGRPGASCPTRESRVGHLQRQARRAGAEVVRLPGAASALACASGRPHRGGEPLNPLVVPEMTAFSNAASRRCAPAVSRYDSHAPAPRTGVQKHHRGIGNNRHGVVVGGELGSTPSVCACVCVAWQVCVGVRERASVLA